MQGRPLIDFWMLSFGQMFVLSGFFSFFQFPLYITHVGGGEQVVGLIMASGTLAGTLTLPWIISMVDRLERRFLMMAGITLVMAATVAVVLTRAPDGWMALLMLLRGLGFVIYLIASGAYVAQIVPENQKSRWIGINFGFNQVAVGLGPLLGEQAILRVGFPYFFFLSTAFLYAGMVLIIGVSRRHPATAAGPFRLRASFASFFREVFGRRYGRPVLALLLVAGTLGAIFNFTALYAQLLGLSSGVFFSTYAVATGSVRFFGSGLADRFGRTLVVAPSLALLGGGVILLTQSASTPLLMATAAVIGVGFGLANPAILAGMLDRATPQLQGMAVGGFHFAYNLGLLATPPLFGAIAERAGYGPMYWLAAAMALAAIAVYLIPGRWLGIRSFGRVKAPPQ